MLFKLITRGLTDLIIRTIRIQIGKNGWDLQEKLEIYRTINTLTDKEVHK